LGSRFDFKVVFPTAHSGHGFHLPKHGEIFTKELTIVPGASYLFEEPGKLWEVARWLLIGFGNICRA